MAVPIDNRSGLRHLCIEKQAPDGALLDVLVVRGTFRLAPGGPLALSDEQTPICMGDAFRGPVDSEPLKAVVVEAGDLVPFKPGTDVIVVGEAQSEGGVPRTEWLAGVAIGPVRKVLHLRGPRQFRRGLLGWRLGAAEPVTATALDWGLAFGGTYGHAPADGAAERVYKNDNPAGCGWLPDRQGLATVSPAARHGIEHALADLRVLDAPRIEHPQRPVTHPTQRVAAEGFGPVARWCAPRLTHAGTYDEAWRSARHPLLPVDFDPAFYQAAAPDQVSTPHLRGDEPIRLVGMCAEGPLSASLPGWCVLASVRHHSGRRVSGPLRLDTVSIDLDAHRVALVWRAAFERHDRVREVALGAVVETAGGRS